MQVSQTEPCPALIKKDTIFERHRHRYEFNNEYRQMMKKNGMIFAGVNPKSGLVEMIELGNHPWFVACQFHPEFKSRPYSPSKVYYDFINECVKYKKKRNNS